MGIDRTVPQVLVDEIRDRYDKGGVSQAKLGSDYGLGETTIYRIVNHLGAYQLVSAYRASDPISPEMKAAAIESIKKLEELQANGGVKEIIDPFIVPNPYYTRKPK